MLVSVHPAGLPEDWGFGDFQSLRLSPGEHPIQPIEPSHLAWLEHSLLFFYKRPSEFGAKLWNGIYFEFKETETGLVGTPQAIDLNSIAAPPKDASLPPFRRALRDAMPPDARWIRSLSIE
jgi:hypothetical protein